MDVGYVINLLSYEPKESYPFLPLMLVEFVQLLAPIQAPLHFPVYAHPSGFSCAGHRPSDTDQVSEQVLTACSPLLHLPAHRWANAASNASFLQWHYLRVCRRGLSWAVGKECLIICCLSPAQGSAWKPQDFILLAGGNRMEENEVLGNPFLSQSCCVCPNY